MTEISKKSIKKFSKNLVAIILWGGITLTGADYGLRSCGKMISKEKETKDLIYKVKAKAAGQDNYLTHEEEVKMARDLGFVKVIGESSPIEIYRLGKEIRLNVGYEGINVPVERARHYLNETL